MRINSKSLPHVTYGVEFDGAAESNYRAAHRYTCAYDPVSRQFVQRTDVCTVTQAGVVSLIKSGDGDPEYRSRVWHTLGARLAILAGVDSTLYLDPQRTQKIPKAWITDTPVLLLDYEAGIAVRSTGQYRGYGGGVACESTAQRVTWPHYNAAPIGASNFDLSIPDKAATKAALDRLSDIRAAVVTAYTLTSGREPTGDYANGSTIANIGKLVAGTLEYDKLTTADVFALGCLSDKYWRQYVSDACRKQVTTPRLYIGK